MVEVRQYHTGTLLADGRVLVAGGVLTGDGDTAEPSAVAELYDPASDAWTATGKMTEIRYSHTATLLADGRVLVAGGASGLIDPPPSFSAELYDPASGSWSPTGNMVTPRLSHAATLLLDGRVLVTGGWDEGSLGPAELYDPGTGTWTAAAGMIEDRYGHTGTLLADGRVLVVGGGGEVTLAEGPAYGASAELYDPSTGRWTATGSMTMARFDHTATRLPDGTVLVVGGSVGDHATARSAELYDPRSGKWTVTSSMANARSGHSATLLPNGTVLATGGVGLGSTPNPLASAELYDPSNGKWTATGSMAEARPYHTATLLPAGRVLVVGDYDYDGRASAEVYDPGFGT